MALYAAIRAQDGSYHYQLLARQGMMLQDVDSAFLTEALALEWALKFVLERGKGSSACNNNLGGV